MGNSKLVIDYIDLVLRLPENCLNAIEAALGRMEDDSVHLEMKPTLKNLSAHLNSTDAITLLGYIDPAELTQFEAAKLEQVMLKALDQLLLRSTTLDKQAHYKWCMAAVKSLALGGYVESQM